jgi:hypothetical protein
MAVMALLIDFHLAVINSKMDEQSVDKVDRQQLQIYILKLWGINCTSHQKLWLRPWLQAFYILSLSCEPLEALHMAYVGLASSGSATASLQLCAEPCTSLTVKKTTKNPSPT